MSIPNGGIFNYLPFQNNAWIPQFVYACLHEKDTLMHLAPLLLAIAVLILILIQLLLRPLRNLHTNANLPKTTSTSINFKKLDNQLDFEEKLDQIQLMSKQEMIDKTPINSLKQTPRQQYKASAYFIGLGYLICILLFFIIVFFTSRSMIRLSGELTILPDRIAGLLDQGVSFIDESISAALQVTVQQMRMNTASSNGSLVVLLDDIKLSLALLVIDLARAEHLQNAARQPLAEQDTTTARWLVELVHILLVRANRLIQALTALNATSEARAQENWYAYKDALSLLLYAKPFKTVILSGFTEDRQDSKITRELPPLLKETEQIICHNINHTNNPLFMPTPLINSNDCMNLKMYFSRLDKYLVNNIYLRLPHDTIRNVTKYSLILQMLNVEKFAHQWRPILTEPITKGGPLLLDHFVQPKLTLLITKLNNFKTHLFSNDRQLKIDSYIRQTIVVILIVSVSLVLLGFLVIGYSCGIWCYRACRKPVLATTKPYANRLGNRGLRVVLFIICITLILVVVCPACFVGVLTSATQTQICRYLVQPVSRDLADVLVKLSIHKYLVNNYIPKTMLKIPQLNLHSPYPLLATCASSYIPDKPGGRLLAKLSLNRPVNLTALLDSDWLNSSLHTVWHDQLRPLIMQTDLIGKLPKTNLFQVYNKTIQTLQLDSLYDNLVVKPVTSYLLYPGQKDLFNPIVSELDSINSTQANYLLPFYRNASHMYHKYWQSYKQIQTALELVDSNKAVLLPLTQILDLTSSAYQFLTNSKPTELADYLERVLFLFWPNAKMSVKSNFIPFLHNLLDQLIPYPNLKNLFQNVVEPVCGTSNSVNTKSHHALIETIRKSALFTQLISISVLLLILFFSFLL